MLKKILGILFILLLPMMSAPLDKSKKAYELIYEDIQLLKQQIAQIESKIDKNTEDIKLIKDQLKDFSTQLKFSQTDQTSFREDLKNLPSQYQILLEKLEQITAQLNRVSENLLALRGAPPTTPEQGQPMKKEGEQPSAKKKKEEEKKEKPPEQKPSTPSSLLSPDRKSVV